jgi:hypothetical protein
MAQGLTDLPAIEAEIERIRSLGLDALRVRWRSMFGAAPPMALTKDLLVRMMAYRNSGGGVRRARSGNDQAAGWHGPRRKARHGRKATPQNRHRPRP